MSLPGPQVSTELTVDVTHGAENVLRFFSVNTIKPSPRYTVGAGKLISLTILKLRLVLQYFCLQVCSCNALAVGQFVRE